MSDEKSEKKKLTRKIFVLFKEGSLKTPLNVVVSTANYFKRC